MKIFSVLVFSLIITYNTSAQQPSQTIRGTVSDIASNVPLPYVNVSLLNTKLGTVTDSIGNFTIKNVGVGRYTIQVSMIGYETYIVNEVQVSSGKEVFINISMKENSISLSEVTFKPKVNKEQPLNSLATVSAKILSVEEAMRYAGGVDDPARLVTSFAGVSSNVSNNAIVVRGNSPQSLQWKMEGVEIPNPNHFADLSVFGGGALTALSSQLLANSDFFSGAMPAEYNNALSGVFDIFMRNGNNQKSEHTFQLGLLGTDFASEGPFKNGGRSSYLFNYRYSTMSLLAPLLPENAGGVTYQDLSFKLNFPTKNSGTFSVWGIGLIDGSGAKAKTDSTEWKYDSDKQNEDVKQYMGAAGISHKLNINTRQYIKSTLAATISSIDLSIDRVNNGSVPLPENKINNKNCSIVLSSFINTKFNARHMNKTGFVATGMYYDIQIKNSLPIGSPLQTIVSQSGFSTLLSAYSNSTINFSHRLSLNIGLNAQIFTLNKHYTIEPRAGIKYRFGTSQSLSLAYGLHSRLERINYYFIKNSLLGNGFINENLNFTKSHHLILGYDISFSELTHLKVEAYYQYLFNVPVIADSSFSTICQQNDWFFDGKLESKGAGKNKGVDITFEKYLSEGYYYMLTGSVFKSIYKGGDNIWRNTRYNRSFTFNFLIGKEWQMGTNKKNILSLNARFSYQGGDRYTPIDTEASNAAHEAIFDETKAFSKQFAPAFTSHFTAIFKINKKKSTHEIAFKIINATSYKEFTDFQYNYMTHNVDERREALIVPNISYKIEF